MRAVDDAKRQLLFDALFKHDGNREHAAKELGMSFRSVNRWIANYDMFDVMDRLGWTKNVGPPRGMPRGSSIIRMRILAHIKKTKGHVDYGGLAEELYGEDSPGTRTRIYSSLEAMRRRGVVEFIDGVWTIKP